MEMADMIDRRLISLALDVKDKEGAIQKICRIKIM